MLKNKHKIAMIKLHHLFVLCHECFVFREYGKPQNYILLKVWLNSLPCLFIDCDQRFALSSYPFKFHYDTMRAVH